MSDYTAGKQREDLDTFLKGNAGDPATIFFANENRDEDYFSHTNFSKTTFANMSFKQTDFQSVDFSYCVFINCYFRGATFAHCNFIGSKFYDLNLRGAAMISCDLSYTHWKDTLIKKEIPLANLPAYENVAQELLISMRKNASSIGEYDDARAFLYESEKQSRRYNLKKFTGTTKYYREEKNYTLDERLLALFSYVRSGIERIVWGYGEKVMNLSVTAIVIVALFALGYFLTEQQFFINGGGVGPGYMGALKLSMSAFSGFNLMDILVAQNQDVRERLYKWFLLESICGLIFIGFLAASLHRKISMRRD